MLSINQKIIEIALSEYGTSEIVGEKHNSRIVQYFREVGFPDIQNDDVGWGVAFVNWVLSKAGQKYPTSLSPRSLLKIGETVTEPQLGDIVVLWRKSSQGRSGLVGFFINEDESFVYILGGNQSNKVKISKYNKKKLLGYRRITSFEEEKTCGCDHETTDDNPTNDVNTSIPTIPVRLVYLGVRKDKKFDEKILTTVSKQLKLSFSIESSKKITQKYDIEALYNEPNIDTAVLLAETHGVKEKGLTILIAESSSSLNGFALRWLNTIFIDYDALSKYSSTIAHEFGHIFGLNHTFELTADEKEKLGIEGESETYNLMNYNVYTDHLTEQQINLVHSSASAKFVVA